MAEVLVWVGARKGHVIGASVLFFGDSRKWMGKAELLSQQL